MEGYFFLSQKKCSSILLKPSHCIPQNVGSIHAFTMMTARLIHTVRKVIAPRFCVPPGSRPHRSSGAIVQSVLQGSRWTPAVCCPRVVIIMAPLLGPQQVMDGVRLEPCSMRLGPRPDAVPLLGRGQATAQGWMNVPLPQHNVALADRARLGAGPAVVLVLFGLEKRQLQIAESTRDHSVTAIGPLRRSKR